MNMDEDSMVHISLKKEQLLGSYNWQGNIDMLNIIMIGLAKEPAGNNEEHRLHRLLGVLLSDTMRANEKLDIIGNEYGIPLDGDIRKDVGIMCNLSQGIMEKGEAIGMEKGEVKFIMNMHKKGYSLEQIADVAEKDIEEVKTVIERQKPVLM